MRHTISTMDYWVVLTQIRDAGYLVAAVCLCKLIVSPQFLYSLQLSYYCFSKSLFASFSCVVEANHVTV